MGCTGGIGQAYTMALAGRGLDLVLVGRSLTKLAALEAKLVARFGCKVIIIQADFTDPSVLPIIVSKIQEAGVEVGVLVNNVGILGPHAMPFLELEVGTVQDMVTVNITAATVLCHQLLPAMLARGRGAVINIASLGSYMHGPYLAEYIATKHYIHSFTEVTPPPLSDCPQSLAMETAGTGVVIQEVDPGVVNTEMTKNFDKAVKSISPDADQFVRSALPTLGFAQRTCGFWSHSLEAKMHTAIKGTWLKSLYVTNGKKFYLEGVKNLDKTK
jgi:short-subunit dehydrogenase